MRNRGFTLIELLVTLFIFSIVLLFIYSTYTGILFDFKDITKQSETQMQTMPGLNILRLDIEHAGYGLASNESRKSIEWDNSTLTIRSTINTTNNKTIGWKLVTCDNNTMQVLAQDDDTAIDNSTKVVWLDVKNDNKFIVDNNGTVISNGTAGTCPVNNAILLGFPYDDNVTSGCSTQFCNVITYTMSNSQDIPTCNQNTSNLLRKVGNSNGNPILNCVADFKVGINNPNKPTLVNVYIVVQEGQKDRNYNFDNTSLSGYGINFSLPSDYQHYRWKVIKLSVKPMSEYGSYP